MAKIEKNDEVEKKISKTKKVAVKEKTTRNAKKEVTDLKKENKLTAKSTSSKTSKKTSKTTKMTSDKTSKKSVITSAKPTVTKRASSKVKARPAAKPMLVEYYDLPYGYNETTVKILAQTPTTLFVYWDISEEDRNNLIKMHGENFFYETKPVLIVHNTTKNYSFEIEINDFANSWYIRSQEPDCNYVIELGRRPFEKPEEYIYINSSNDIVSPNDHILFEKANLGNVIFKNVKTGSISSKDFGSLRFINDIDKLYGNIYDVYSRLYKDEQFNELTNPSSGEFIMRS